MGAAWTTGWKPVPLRPQPSGLGIPGVVAEYRIGFDDPAFVHFPAVHAGAQADEDDPETHDDSEQVEQIGGEVDVSENLGVGLVHWKSLRHVEERAGLAD